MTSLGAAGRPVRFRGLTGCPLGSKAQAPPSDQLVARVERRMTVAMILAHGLGALDVLVLLLFVLPEPGGGVEPVLTLGTAGLMFTYFVGASIIGWWVATSTGRRATEWIRAGRVPTEAERLRVLRRPMVCTALDAVAWLGAVIVFGAVSFGTSVDVGLHVGGTILLGGLTTCAIAYLVTERIMRPVTAYALGAGPAQPGPVGPGVKGRVLLAWLFATGVPLLGIVIVGCQGLTDPAIDPDRVAASVLVLGIMALAVGLGMMVVVAQSVAQPLNAMRRALARVEGGDLEAEVRVDDSSEVGQLQSSFNRMAAGLREREQIRDLFGRHVGEDVARAALAGAGPALDRGELRDVAVLFVDLVGSTTLTAQRPPTEVVALLNRFFTVIVDVVARHGGWVNKFEGDAALCVFGAPTEQPDAAACALAAARELHERLAVELPETRAGIGLSAGPAVAGWVGAEARLEYTVLGDPVNEAARLCDLAKRRPEGVLASEAVVRAAGTTDAAECARWELGEETVLRGRPSPTRLAAPAAVA